MITATLRYDLEDMDSRLAHKRACNADDAYLTILAVYGVVKEMWETCEEGDEIDKLRVRLLSALSRYNINMEDLP